MNSSEQSAESKKMFIPILLGTMRQGRESEKVANWILSQVSANSEIETELIDPRDLYLPNDDDGLNIAAKNPKYQQTIARADALIIVSPEYNHGYPGTLKRVLDMLFDEYNRKPVGIVGVSDGNFGGARMIEGLLPVLRTIGMVTISSDLSFPNVDKLFEADGSLKDPSAYEKRFEKFIGKLLWMSRTLKWGRNNLK